MFAACVAGEEDPESRPDAGALAPPNDAGGEVPVPPDAAPEEEQTACLPAGAPIPNGNHNPGQACQSCHTPTANIPRWTVAGTLFSSAAGGAAVSAATIVVVDNNGVELKLVTAANGNFYTTTPVAFPVTVKASKCPDEKAMTAKPGSGNCNSCHTAGSAQGRIHLP